MQNYSEFFDMTLDEFWSFINKRAAEGNLVVQDFNGRELAFFQIMMVNDPNKSAIELLEWLIVKMKERDKTDKNFLDHHPGKGMSETEVNAITGRFSGALNGQMENAQILVIRKPIGGKL